MQEYKERDRTLTVVIRQEVGHFLLGNGRRRSLDARLLGAVILS